MDKYPEKFAQKCDKISPFVDIVKRSKALLDCVCVLFELGIVGNRLRGCWRDACKVKDKK